MTPLGCVHHLNVLSSNICTRQDMSSQEKGLHLTLASGRMKRPEFREQWVCHIPVWQLWPRKSYLLSFLTCKVETAISILQTSPCYYKDQTELQMWKCFARSKALYLVKDDQRENYIVLVLQRGFINKIKII